MRARRTILLGTMTVIMGCAAMNTHVTLFYPPLPNKTKTQAAAAKELTHLEGKAIAVKVIDKRENKALAVTSYWTADKPVTFMVADNDPATWVRKALLSQLEMAGCRPANGNGPHDQSDYVLTCTLQCLTLQEFFPAKMPAYAFLVGTTRRVKAAVICFDFVLEKHRTPICSGHMVGHYVVEESFLKSKKHETNFFALALRDACVKTTARLEDCLTKKDTGLRACREPTDQNSRLIAQNRSPSGRPVDRPPEIGNCATARERHVRWHPVASKRTP